MTAPRRVTVEFDEFGWSALVAEATRQNVSPEELVAHATMYYLSDLDSGRAAARVFEGGDQGRRPRFDRRAD